MLYKEWQGTNFEFGSLAGSVSLQVASPEVLQYRLMKPNWFSFMSSNPGSMAMLLTNATFFQDLSVSIVTVHTLQRTQ